MKLVIAIVNSDDAKRVQNAMTEAGFYITKLSTMGGFLQNGNATFLTGVEDEKVDSVREVLKANCSRRRIYAENPFSYGDSFMPEPMEIVVGGATVFVLDVDQFYKL